MKRFFALVLVLIMVTIVSISALADGEYTVVDIGYIKYSINSDKWQKAPELVGDYGHRIWFTCATALFPAAPYDYEYTDSDWKKIEDTWISVQVLVPKNTVCRIWCYSWKQGSQTYNGGYLLELGQGYYEFAIKNGEVQNWPKDESFSAVDLNRIFDQTRNGNANVEQQLAFTGITTNLEDRVPTDLTYSKVVDGPTSSFAPTD